MPQSPAGTDHGRRDGSLGLLDRNFTRPGNVASAASIIKEAIAAGETFRAHSFELACARNDIDHRLTKSRHPWTNGQVERMNRTIKDAT
ncbi:hypothetical protein BHAOGJBA_2728 [Methylobacterium hispanicum]|jgi:transposase InsO family protein|uniref:Integrase catalytic domain-containing protein n=1 Tax=Methylobacterium hispanicum TaxID=270350 RepID=A0AAV4ZLZ2_9HYPH|nr:hypothetical protein BHAOGJBA_2728 [Methylobacterium hispanicum]